MAGARHKPTAICGGLVVREGFVLPGRRAGGLAAVTCLASHPLLVSLLLPCLVTSLHGSSSSLWLSSLLFSWKTTKLSNPNMAKSLSK